MTADPSGELRVRVEKMLTGRVWAAKTLAGVRQHFARAEPELLVADVELDGCLDLVESLRSDHPDMNVLLVTKRAASARIAGLLQLGAVDVLRKPFNDAELELRLGGLAARRPALPWLNVSAKPLLTLHDAATGRIDAREIAKAYGLSLRALSAALGRKPQTVSKTPSSTALQPQLAHFLRSYELLFKLLGDQTKVRAWLNTPQPDLAGQQPIALFKKGDAEAVRNFLEVMYAGGPS